VSAIDAAAPAPAVVAVASIASVQLAQDCPDAKTASKADTASSSEPPAKMKAKRARGAGPLVQPCTQSNVQIAFTGKGAASAPVAIEAVRLMSADGTELATLAVRMPSLWVESGYQAWDGVLGADSDQKASYKLSVPTWSEIDRQLGGSSFEQMYTLEMEVDIGGTVSTITSPQFERAQPLMIKT
tara:strand:+ start:8056 stop:8610 length:555 start_codon:yes stop_codon:yes gene_type:complete